MRVLCIRHSAVVDEYRQRERLLARLHGHDVQVVCPPAWEEGGRLVAPTADAEVPLHIVRIAGPRKPNLFWYRPSELRAVIRAVEPEIVDLHEEPYSLAAAGALRAVAQEAPHASVCIYSAQNLDRRYPPPFSWIERLALTRASAAYPCSAEAGARLRARGFRGLIEVTALGVSLPAERPRPPGPTRVGFVGRLEPYKGAMIALQAYLDAASDSDAVLEVIGDGSELAAMRACVEGAGAVERVTFTGAIPQPEALDRIGQLDVLLVPSLTTPTWKEQFGRVAAQAMAAGVAVIASDSGSLREVVADGGVLVPEGDVKAFAAALQGLLADPALRSDLADRGRRRAGDQFAWEAVAAQADRMYEHMSKGLGPDRVTLG